MKQLLKKTITGIPFLRNVLNSVTGAFPKVFVYHRFASSSVRIKHRVSADEFGWQLDQILKEFNVITFADCLRYFRGHGQWPKNTVIITVDDGYRDFYEYAYPELVKRGLKATFFVTTNFVGRKIWLWPDMLEHAIQTTVQSEFTVLLNGDQVRFSLGRIENKMLAMQVLVTYCISSPDAEKERLIAEVLIALDVELPDAPCPEYDAVSWDELREMSREGIEIGSHTLNHPILSRIDQTRLIDEVITSREVLNKELDCDILSFCYPNSGPNDISADVIKIVKSAGYTGAVFGTDLKTWTPFEVPRMGLTHDRIDFLWKLYGGELL